MKTARLLISFLLIALIGGSIASTASAQRGGRNPGGRGPTGRGNRDSERQGEQRYSVLRIGDEIRLVEAEQLDGLVSETRKADAKALREHTRAKREAARQKLPFDEPKPVAKRIQVIEKSISDRAKAEEIRDRFAAKLAKANQPVFSVMELDGEYQLATQERIVELKSSIAEEYKTALRDYNASKKEAARNGEEFGSPRPTKRSLRVLPRKFPTEQDALLYIAQLRNRDR